DVAALAGAGTLADVAVRGEPSAVLVALDAATGAPGWKLAIDATAWSLITALAATPDGGVLAAGSFTGTLRVADQIVSSGGRSDGFIARITPTGGVAWLRRVGGPGADAIQGVAMAAGAKGDERIAIAGTFAAGADLLGQPLAASEDRAPTADGFVAELDGHGARRWVQTFGGPQDEAVAGVAIDARGRFVVAATVRETVHVAGVDLVAQGPSDGLVAWFGPGGSAATATLVGGADFDGLRAIVAAGDHVVVAGFFSGALPLGARSLTAAGGDDAFLAELAPAPDGATAVVTGALAISGPGREEVTTLTALPGGLAAGIGHTAQLQIAGAPALAAPADPMAGNAVILRAVPLAP
ncbi:MAG TPA: hypothetical protein VFP84_27225, partial [Kofleriaceae bacterium]|nr:hypothetical protein [Kofleriaceae bacterium]